MDRTLPQAQQSARTSVKPKITLSSYVEQVKRLTLDVWQQDICARLEKAFWLSRASFFNFQTVDIGAGPAYVIAPSGFKIDKEEFDKRKSLGTHAAVHAPPQFGKSIIISQAYPAWILGYDPVHRFRLATYNISHSKAFSEVVLNILRSPEHQALFPDPAGHVPNVVSTVKWFTNARRAVNDGQSSFTALGLQSGFVGTGADTLLMDDPYKSIEEALSEVIRDKTWRFYTDTAEPRLDDHSNAYIMFHRYHEDDIAGRAIATGVFELWRYAAIADGDYEDHETGRVFPDPLNRQPGEVLSPRKTPAYYERQQASPGVWNSQFQGRPTSIEGDFFNVKLLNEIDLKDVPRLVHEIRAWDNAATEGGGAYTAGVRMGFDSAGKVYISSVKREQVNTAGREALQLKTAEEDGLLVLQHGPRDPASAGKDVAFYFERMMSEAGYPVETTLVSGKKELRAYNFSLAVNRGDVFLVKGDWDIKAFRNELKNFPVGTYKDQVDAGSDGYNHLMRLFHQGLVVKSFTNTNLLGWSLFQKRFGVKVPEDWEVSAAIRIAADASKPSGWAIVTRAAEFAGLGEVVFIVASSRLYTDDPGRVIKGLQTALKRFTVKGEALAVWLGKQSADVVQLAAEKYGLGLTWFEDDADAGVPETNWYFQKVPALSPFTQTQGASHAYALIDDVQYDAPTDEDGQLSLRQDVIGWSYNEKGEPQPFGGITLDCVRMNLCAFALSATRMNKQQRIISQLPEHLKPEAVAAKLGQEGKDGFVETYWAAKHATNQIEKKEAASELEEKKAWARVRPQAKQRKWRS